MTHTAVAEILALKSPRALTIKGWVRSRRDSKAFSFFAVNDGTCVANLQVVVDETCEGGPQRTTAATGASVEIEGTLIVSPGKGQRWELQARRFVVLGEAPEDFPLQKKGHSKEFLREISHLRPRTNLFGVVFRMRSRLSFAVHRFFQERGYFQVHTPILTSSDCEGAGEMFQVSVPGESEPFFGKEAYLTVSGQLEGETYATALSKIYTFGPTFRAENSHTSRHASEFWMIEPEMAFCTLDDLMECAEAFLRYLTQDVLDQQQSDLAFLNSYVDQELQTRLEGLIAEPFARVRYHEATEILAHSGRTFEHPFGPETGLQSEHERYLCEEHFGRPTFVTHYPACVKPFYMKQIKGETTVAAMDLLVPGIGELIGGSQREEDYTLLRSAMQERGVSTQDYQWYLDLRKYGSVPHAGFGAGFERLMMLMTGMRNIRDVIPYPRTPGSCAP